MNSGNVIIFFCGFLILEARLSIFIWNISGVNFSFFVKFLVEWEKEVIAKLCVIIINGIIVE